MLFWALVGYILGSEVLPWCWASKRPSKQGVLGFAPRGLRAALDLPSPEIFDAAAQENALSLDQPRFREDLESKRTRMDSFSSPSMSSSGSPPNTEALMDQIKAQLAQAYAQEFLEVRSRLILVYRLVLSLMEICIDC